MREPAKSHVATMALMTDRPWAHGDRNLPFYIRRLFKGVFQGFELQLQFANLLLLPREANAGLPSVAFAVSTSCSASRRQLKSWLGSTQHRH